MENHLHTLLEVTSGIISTPLFLGAILKVTWPVLLLKKEIFEMKLRSYYLTFWEIHARSHFEKSQNDESSLMKKEFPHIVWCALYHLVSVYWTRDWYLS